MTTSKFEKLTGTILAYPESTFHLPAESASQSLPLSAETILTHPDLVVILKRQARALMDIYVHNQRETAVFATQQRWLLSHLAISMFLETGSIVAARFIDAAEKYGISSRNTADAMLKECVKYGMVIPLANANDSRLKPFALPAPIVSLIAEWCALHLATLDGFDGGGRLAHFRSHPDLMARLQPAITRRVIICAPIRNPDPAFSLFIWLNDGGVVMDWLYAGMDKDPDMQGHILSTVDSISELGRHLTISRSHLALKLREAEATKTLGWSGKRGKSRLWLSQEFRAAYHQFQANKLGIIDEAFRETA